jgi:hypothetical protein
VALEAADCGTADAGPAIQAAIDRVQSARGFGIVLIGPGTYRLRSTVDVWRGIRLIGYGRTRPRLVLERATKGFDGPTSRYLLHFRDERPRPGAEPPDAKNTTFYSGLSNVDIEIGQDNPCAVALRFRVAQLCSIEHVDFHLSGARAGIEAVGNEIEDCRFLGGQRAIQYEEGTSAGWQTLLMDCLFEGQSEAAIEGDRAGLTLVRCEFRNVPRGIVVPPGKVEKMYLEDCRFENVADAAVVCSQREDPNLQINVERCRLDKVATFLRWRDGHPSPIEPAQDRAIVRLSHGLHIEPDAQGAVARRMGTDAATAPFLSDEPRPAPAGMPAQETWASVRDFGATGDGRTDDTAALRRAIAASGAVYLPMGKYRLTNTLTLRHDTALIGLHPHQTQFVLADGTSGFGDPDRPRAMVEAPPGSRCIFSGLGLDPGRNRGAVGLRWMAGADSLVDDVWLEWGGHGDDPKGRDVLHSLWVTGGGTFRNIWSPNIRSRSGLLVSDTHTPGRAYLVSVEHHLEREVRLERVSHWRFVALQTEENRGSERAAAIEMIDCHDIELANVFLYRVMSLTVSHPHAIHMKGCRDIVIRGVHSFSWGKRPFDNTLHDADRGDSIPDREAAWVRAC